MKTSLAKAVACALLVTSFGQAVAVAQDIAPAAAQGPDEAAPKLSVAELDQMLAPIALYPDTLLAQILMASTYPLEVVQAHRWLQDTGNAALRGDQLEAALNDRDWDPSVKSLVPFPKILEMMDANLDWTERLGDAFLADQAGVMDSVQRLRQRADAAGKLRTTPQQVVETRERVITIETPNPEIVYVPVYDPGVVYGTWPYPAYLPYYFPGYFNAVVLGGFGYGWFGAPIFPPFWGWGRWDWHHHRIHIDHNGHDHHHRPGGGGDWRHDPQHRHGVPYRNPETRKRFGGDRGSRDEHRDSRGYPPAQKGQPRPGDKHPGALPGHEPRPGDRHPGTQPGRGVKPGDRQPAIQQDRRLHAGGTGLQRQQWQPARPPTSQRVPPVAESFGRGADVRAQANRGRESRMPEPSFRPRPTPQPRSAPQHNAPPPSRGGGQHSDRRH